MMRHHLGRCVAPVLAALLILAASCTSTPDADTTPSMAPSRDGPDGASNTPSRVMTAAGCPVTIPRSVPRRYSWRASLFGWESSYGNGKLWVGGLGAHGVIAIDRDLLDHRGHVSWKLGWWREVPGQLVITGRRLDGAGRLRSDAGTVEQYGPKGFVASDVTFSNQGCWRITGRVDGTALTFWTRVIIRPE